jgi:hypothetical protein
MLGTTPTLPAGCSILRCVSLLLLAAGPGSRLECLSAQTVSPPIAEYQERARSSFQLSNGTIFPLNVVLEVRGFGVTEDGTVMDAPLDTSRIHVKLSAMSFRIPPRGTYTVFYEARADSTPAWFNILSALSGARTESGLNVRVLLPHVVYLNQKRPIGRADVLVRGVEFDSAGGKVRVHLENTGPNLGRVLQLTAAGGGGESSPSAGFPLFPHSLRWAELAWTNPRPPDRVAVRFARFTIDTLLASVTAAHSAGDAVPVTPPSGSSR